MIYKRRLSDKRLEEYQEKSMVVLFTCPTSYDLVTFFPPSAEGEPTSFYWKKKANMWLSQNDAALAAVVQQFLLLDFSFQLAEFAITGADVCTSLQHHAVYLPRYSYFF